MFRFFNFEIERVYYVLNNGFIFEVIVFDEDELDGSVILLLGVIVLILGDIVLIGVILLKSVIVLLGEFIEDFGEMLSSGNFFKEGKIEEIFLF